jgi:vacuolar protein sorting-associated protein 53
MFYYREDLVTVLTKAVPTLTAALLLESLQQTTEFESFLGKKFEIPVCDHFELVLNYFYILQYADMLIELASTVGIRHPKPMSVAFEPHMGVFVDVQDKSVMSILLHQSLNCII